MFILHFLHWLTGSVVIRVWGGFNEQFLNLCHKKSIWFWKSYCRDGALYLHMLPQDVHRLPEIARATGMRVHIVKKTGAAFLIRRYRWRWGIPAGVGLFLFMLFYLSGFVWTVEIDLQSQFVTEEQVLAALEEAGVYPGARIEELDMDLVQNACLQRLEALKWMGITTNGTVVQVQMRDKIPTPQDAVSEGEPCHVKASRDAQIISIMPYAGTTIVKPGDTVRAGQIIVSGVEEDRFGNVTLTHSRAEVIGQTNYQAEIRVPVTVQENVYTGKSEKRVSLFLFGFEVNFYQDSGNPPYTCDTIINKNFLHLFGTQLPIGAVTQELREYYVVDKTRDEAQMQQAVEDALAQYEAQNFQGKTILSRQVEETRTKEEYILRVQYTCEEDIAVQEAVA